MLLSRRPNQSSFGERIRHLSTVIMDGPHCRPIFAITWTPISDTPSPNLRLGRLSACAVSWTTFFPSSFRHGSFHIFLRNAACVVLSLALTVRTSTLILFKSDQRFSFLFGHLELFIFLCWLSLVRHPLSFHFIFLITGALLLVVLLLANFSSPSVYSPFFRTNSPAALWHLLDYYRALFFCFLGTSSSAGVSLKRVSLPLFFQQALRLVFGVS